MAADGALLFMTGGTFSFMGSDRYPFCIPMWWMAL
jgi:hypothetical protein